MKAPRRNLVPFADNAQSEYLDRSVGIIKKEITFFVCVKGCDALKGMLRKSKQGKDNFFFLF